MLTADGRFPYRDPCPQIIHNLDQGKYRLLIKYS